MYTCEQQRVPELAPVSCGVWARSCAGVRIVVSTVWLCVCTCMCMGGRVVEVAEPPVRKAGVKVDSVDTLISKLKNEAGVI